MSLKNGQYQGPASGSGGGGANVTVPVNIVTAAQPGQPGQPASNKETIVEHDDNGCGYGVMGFVISIFIGFFAYLFLLCLNMGRNQKRAFIIGTTVGVVLEVIFYIIIIVVVVNNGDNSYYYGY